MDISDITNASWLNGNKTRLECMYRHPIYGWIPFTADISDKSSISSDIFSIIDKLEIAGPLVSKILISNSTNSIIQRKRPPFRWPSF